VVPEADTQAPESTPAGWPPGFIDSTYG